MRLRAGDAGSFGAVVTLDGAPVRFCTYADDEAGVVRQLMLVQASSFGRTAFATLDDPTTGKPVRVAEETRHGVVCITLGDDYAAPPGVARA